MFHCYIQILVSFLLFQLQTCSSSTNIPNTEVAGSTLPSKWIAPNTTPQSRPAPTSFPNNQPRNYTMFLPNVGNFQFDESRYVRWMTLRGNGQEVALALGGTIVSLIGAGLAPKVVSSSSVYVDKFERQYCFENSDRIQLTEDGVCHYTIYEKDIFNFIFEDGHRVTQISYQCIMASEYCCNDLDCCQKVPMTDYLEQMNNKLKKISIF